MKSVAKHPKPVRMKFRSNQYLGLVRGESCLACDSPQFVHAHHLRHAGKRGWGQKVSDEFAVPLCALCHAECHTRGRESEWWAMKGIDPVVWAKEFYRRWNDVEYERGSTGPGVQPDDIKEG